jgi:hypothetical protein
MTESRKKEKGRKTSLHMTESRKYATLGHNEKAREG